MDLDQRRFQGLITQLRQDFPRFDLRYKDESRFMKVLGVLLFFVDGFMSRFATTMFGKVYLPSRQWVSSVGYNTAYILLRHEAVHLRDARRFSILFGISYLLVLPTIFTFRALWEWRGYTETMRAYKEVYGSVPPQLTKRIVSHFVGPSYFFMFPFKGFLEKRLERFRQTLT